VAFMTVLLDVTWIINRAWRGKEMHGIISVPNHVSPSHFLEKKPLRKEGKTQRLRGRDES
jgi:hypothetical protein